MTAEEFRDAVTKLCRDSGFYIYPEDDMWGLCFNKEKPGGKGYRWAENMHFEETHELEEG